MSLSRIGRLAVLVAINMTCAGCLTPERYRGQADEVAYEIIQNKQVEALGRQEPFTVENPADTLRRRLLLDQHLPVSVPASLNTHDIEPIAQWPDDAYLEPDSGERSDWVSGFDTAEVLELTLVEALQIAAHSSREYQDQKESVFQVALQLDLERNEFRQMWSGVVTQLFRTDLERSVVINEDGDTDLQPVTGAETGGTLGVEKRFRNGIGFAGALGLDLASLLTQERLFSRGIFADVTVTVPLLRGAGEFVVTEPLTQAERNVVYAIYQFERFKREFAVEVASQYFAVLRQLDSVDNASDNYRRLIASTRRARRLADAGRLPEIQVDQSRQDELRARNQWVSSREAYQRQIDGFKLQLGLPTDAALQLDPGELKALAAATEGILPEVPAGPVDEEAPSADAPIELPPPGRGQPGRFELEERKAVELALGNRLDLRVAIGRIFDSQRAVAVAADQLRADLTLLGSGAAGAQRTIDSAGLDDAILRPDEGSYSALLTLDLPFERTLERNQYRLSLLGLEQAVRDLQALEDQIKLDVRNGLSRLLESRESILIQAESVRVAERRVASTSLFLEAGRAEIRDVLEAQDALVNAQNALTAALVNYRVNELALQRDLGLLEVDHSGLWREYEPE